MVYYDLRVQNCAPFLAVSAVQWHAEKGQRDGPALSDDRPPQAVMEQHDENDLTQYKLSPEELEEKQRTLKHRPLQDPAVLGLTRKQRPDGSWYVTGARPASAMSAATEDTTTRRGRATAQKPRSRSVPRRRALASDDEDAKENVRPRSRSRSRSSVGGQAVLERVERAIHLRQRVAAGSNGVGEKGPQEPDRAPARKNGAVATTAAGGG